MLFQTRMQVLTPGSTTVGGVGSVFSEMVRKEGLLRPLRGIGSMIGSAGPAHALYFSCYEFIKNKLINSRTHQFNNLVYGFAGCVATLLHDGVMNPAEGTNKNIIFQLKNKIKYLFIFKVLLQNVFIYKTHKYSDQNNLHFTTYQFPV